jgi:Nickel responsive protein SCO4226-like
MTTHVFLERTFDSPLSVADVAERARRSDWCYTLHKVDWRGSYLAADGRALICWFAAPDAESARIALRQSGADTQVLWAGTVYEGPGPAVPNVVVERSFGAPVAFEKIRAMAVAAEWCLETHHVKYARTFFSADQKRMLCFYEAPDAESVRLAQRQGAMPVDAVWAFERIGPDTMAPSSG